MKHLSAAVLAAVSLVAASGASMAQAPARAAAPDTVAIGWAKRLLTAKHAQEAFMSGLDSAFAEQQREGSPQMPKVFFDSLTAYVHRTAPQLIDSLATIYAAAISLADLKELVRFYESPVGQRYGGAEVTLSLRFAEIAKVWGMRVALDVMKNLLDKGLMTDMPPEDAR